MCFLINTVYLKEMLQILPTHSVCSKSNSDFIPYLTAVLTASLQGLYLVFISLTYARYRADKMVMTQVELCFYVSEVYSCMDQELHDSECNGNTSAASHNN